MAQQDPDRRRSAYWLAAVIGVLGAGTYLLRLACRDEVQLEPG
jgi:hypothetical protein